MTGESIFDGNMAGGAIRIGDTPLSISVYSVEKAPTRIHDKGMLEIIFCLKGSVRFSYAYEEFTLHAGEYISVDKDAYYLYDGRDNLCVSFYFDLTRYTDKYPFICNNLFVCEGLAETTMRYPTSEHRRLKGMMIALLKYIRSQAGEKSSSSLTVGGTCADSTSAKDISADSLYGGVLPQSLFPRMSPKRSARPRKKSSTSSSNTSTCSFSTPETVQAETPKTFASFIKSTITCTAI